MSAPLPTARPLLLAAALLLGLGSLALAQGTPDQPGRVQTETQPQTQSRSQAQSERQPQTGSRRASRRPPGYRSAKHRGGSGASWKTGRDAYGFAGSYGGCRFRGNAGPNGYRLDRSC